MHPPDAWADQFESQNAPEKWAEDFAAGRERELAQGLGPGDQEYIMAADNPFLSVRQLLKKLLPNKRAFERFAFGHGLTLCGGYVECE